MDSVTQFALGAAVGEAMLGSKIGNRAPLVGGALGILPDADVLTTPFVSVSQSFVIHRGLTHSVLFTVLIAPVLGLLLARLFRKEEVSARLWGWLAFVVIGTHIVLDCCTTYGTQVLYPFSRYPVSWSFIFVIDPLYTIPLALGLGWAVFRAELPRRRWWANGVGLMVSTLYLLTALGLKTHAATVFQESLRAQHGEPDRMMVSPTPFNAVLWKCVAERGDSLWVGLYSVADDDRQIVFKRFDKNTRLLDNIHSQLPVRRLLRFSQGYYTVEESAGELYFNDVRFGRTDMWMTDTGHYIFRFQLIRSEGSGEQRVTIRHEATRDITWENLERLFFRMLGEDAVRQV